MGYSIAYNSGTTTPFGTYKQGTITMGLKPDEYTFSSGFTWYANAETPNDNYLIISDTYSQGWSTQTEAKPTIWRSETGTTESFVSLVNQLPDVNGITGFTDSGSAMAYLQNSGKYFVSKDDYLGVVSDGLVFNLDAGWYPSYSGSGTTWKDIKGLNNGTLINGAGFNSSNGGFFTFDGVDDRSNTDSNLSSLPLGDNPRTMSYWIYPTKTTSSTLIQIAGYGLDNGVSNLFCGSISSNGKSFLWANSNNYTSSHNITLNTWQQITWVKTTGYLVCYKNGISDGGRSYTLNTVASRPYMGIVFQSNIYDKYQGYIGNFLIYNRALSSSEVLQNYNATKGRFGL